MVIRCGWGGFAPGWMVASFLLGGALLLSAPAWGQNVARPPVTTGASPTARASGEDQRLPARERGSGLAALILDGTHLPAVAGDGCPVGGCGRTSIAARGRPLRSERLHAAAKWERHEQKVEQHLYQQRIKALQRRTLHLNDRRKDLDRIGAAVGGPAGEPQKRNPLDRTTAGIH